MLKSVVEEDYLAGVLRDCLIGGGHTVAILHVRHAGKFLGEFLPFIVQRSGDRFISATDQCDADLAVHKPPGQPFHQGRFAGAAERDVADTDDRDRDAVSWTATRVKIAVPAINDPGIWQFADTQNSAQQAGSQPPAAPAYHITKIGRIEQS